MPSPHQASAQSARQASAQSARRIACLLVPALPLAAALRAEPELSGLPLAIASAPGPRGEVLACSPEARRAGVRVGSGVVHARASCAALRVRTLSLAQEESARAALLDAALASAPRAELAPRATGFFAAEAAVYVDARGISRLFPSEAGFAAALVLRVARLGLPAVVALAGARGVAQIAARELARREAPGAVEVIAPGGDAAYLAPLAVDLLNPDDALADALSRFGLRRVGDLLRMPERALVNRLGPGLLPLLALARGEDGGPPLVAPAAARFEEATDLEAPVAELEPLLFVLRGLLTRLAERLACRGLAFGELALDCRLEGGGSDARRIGLAAPTRDVRVVLRLLALALEAAPPPAAIESIAVATDGARARGDQLDFFAPAGPAPAALDRTLAELAALCGAERVGAPMLADEHRPDAYALAPFRPEATRAPLAGAPGAAPPANALTVRALRPPLPAAVQSARGAPHRLQSALANGEVVRCAGPWRTTGRWWSEDRYAFDHYDVETADGLVVRLRCDLLHSHWFIDAVYD